VVEVRFAVMDLHGSAAAVRLLADIYDPTAPSSSTGVGVGFAMLVCVVLACVPCAALSVAMRKVDIRARYSAARTATIGPSGSSGAGPWFVAALVMLGAYWWLLKWVLRHIPFLVATGFVLFVGAAVVAVATLSTLSARDFGIREVTGLGALIVVVMSVVVWWQAASHDSFDPFGDQNSVVPSHDWPYR
jgi:hypothetical protein